MQIWEIIYFLTWLPIFAWYFEYSKKLTYDPNETVLSQNNISRFLSISTHITCITCGHNLFFNNRTYYYFNYKLHGVVLVPITHCPHCKRDLNITGVQTKKYYSVIAESLTWTTLQWKQFYNNPEPIYLKMKN